ncbi:MAG TPA: acyl-CoA dehydrogenase [Myxococcota bacterium]|nr:acyl-CoA dehydrogenase [Myxococcota bacterium]
MTWSDSEPEDEASRDLLSHFGQLYSLSVLTRERGWFQERGYLAETKSRALVEQAELMLAELRPELSAVVEAFGIPRQSLGAPIAL